jgi:hypothetical protein
MKAQLSELERRIDDKFVERPLDLFGAAQSTAASDAGTAFSGQTSEIAELKSSLQWVSWSRSRSMLGGEPNAASSDALARSKAQGTNGAHERKDLTDGKQNHEREKPAIPAISIPAGGLHGSGNGEALVENRELPFR